MAVDVVKVRGELGAAIKYKNAERATDRREALACGLIENEIERQLADAPPLSAIRAARLCAVIQGYVSEPTDALTA